MCFRQWYLFSALFLTLPAFAAQPAPSKLSDDQLRKMAIEELALPQAGDSSQSTHGTVVTAAIFDGSQTERPSHNIDFEFGVQRYQLSGQGSIIGNESYALNQLGSSSMGLLAVVKWWKNESAADLQYGLRLAAGYSRASMKIISATGMEFRDVLYRSVPVSLSPILDYSLPKAPRLSFGVQAGLGELFAVQTGSSSVTNNSANEAFYEAGAYSRYALSSTMLLKLSYLRRDMLNNKSALEIQQNNYSLLVGVSL